MTTTTIYFDDRNSCLSARDNYRKQFNGNDFVVFAECYPKGEKK
jgi:hypothetical protein